MIVSGTIEKINGILSESFALARMGLDFLGMAHDKSTMVRLHRDITEAAPRGAGQVVLVLPGFGANDSMSEPLRNFLNAQGYKAYGWDCGTNLGPSIRTLRAIRDRIETLHKEHDGQKIKLIGHSMGGFMAREASRDFPHMISQTITLGAPFAIVNGAEEATSQTLRRAFEMANENNRRIASDEALLRRAARLPGVPTTSIYTSKDGWIDWRACLNPQHPRAENIEAGSSHCGLIYHPHVWLTIADRLAQNPEQWKKFNSEKYDDFPLPFIKEPAHEALDLPQVDRIHRHRGPGLFAV